MTQFSLLYKLLGEWQVLAAENFPQLNHLNIRKRCISGWTKAGS